MVPNDVGASVAGSGGPVPAEDSDDVPEPSSAENDEAIDPASMTLDETYLVADSLLQNDGVSNEDRRVIVRAISRHRLTGRDLLELTYKDVRGEAGQPSPLGLDKLGHQLAFIRMCTTIRAVQERANRTRQTLPSEPTPGIIVEDKPRRKSNSITSRSRGAASPGNKMHRRRAKDPTPGAMVEPTIELGDLKEPVSVPEDRTHKIAIADAPVPSSQQTKDEGPHTDSSEKYAKTKKSLRSQRLPLLLMVVFFAVMMFNLAFLYLETSPDLKAQLGKWMSADSSSGMHRARDNIDVGYQPDLSNRRTKLSDETEANAGNVVDDHGARERIANDVALVMVSSLLLHSAELHRVEYQSEAQFDSVVEVFENFVSHEMSKRLQTTTVSDAIEKVWHDFAEKSHYNASLPEELQIGDHNQH